MSATRQPVPTRGRHVLIAGGGIGGLCLAQGLRRTGIRATIFEKDAAPNSRAQGYRLGLKGEGERALRACLPADLADLCAATALRTATRLVFMGPDLTPKFAKSIPPAGPGQGFGVYRLTLREILLTDLDGDIHFGRECVGYEQSGDRVIALLADGSTVEGDLLVGADGTGSAIRRQLVTDAEIDELDWAIYGRTSITPGLLAQTPGELVDSFNRVLGPDNSAISIATCRPVTPIAEAVTRLAPRARLTETPEFFSWTATMPGPCPVAASPAELHRMAAAAVEGWHTGVVRIVADADVAATFLVPITSARPVRPWTSRVVTLLGDAVHTMSPGRGDGANVALRDALQLRDALAGSADWPTAKRAYEEDMLAFGFAAVQASRDRPFAPTTRPVRPRVD